MDTGDIILQMETLIHPDENAGDLHDRLAALGAKALSESLELLQLESLKEYPKSRGRYLLSEDR